GFANQLVASGNEFREDRCSRHGTRCRRYGGESARVCARAGGHVFLRLTRCYRKNNRSIRGNATFVGERDSKRRARKTDGGVVPRERDRPTSGGSSGIGQKDRGLPVRTSETAVCNVRKIERRLCGGHNGKGEHPEHDHKHAFHRLLLNCKSPLT